MQPAPSPARCPIRLESLPLAPEREFSSPFLPLTSTGPTEAGPGRAVRENPLPLPPTPFCFQAPQGETGGRTIGRIKTRLSHPEANQGGRVSPLSTSYCLQNPSQQVTPRGWLAAGSKVWVLGRSVCKATHTHTPQTRLASGAHRSAEQNAFAEGLLVVRGGLALDSSGWRTSRQLVGEQTRPGSPPRRARTRPCPDSALAARLGTGSPPERADSQRAPRAWRGRSWT